MNKRYLYNALYYLQLNRLSRLFLEKPHSVILAYHRVSPLNRESGLLQEMVVSPIMFERQIKYLLKHYKVISLKQLVDSFCNNERETKNSVVITFDDSYADNYLYAFPILKKYALSATMFVSTAFIGTQKLFWWDRLSFILENTRKEMFNFDYRGSIYKFKLGKKASAKKAFRAIAQLLKHSLDTEKEEFLDKMFQHLEIKNGIDYPRNLQWEEVEEMAKDNIIFGAHTHNHYALSALSEEQLKEELSTSKEMLEGCLNQKVTLFSYPYGEENDFNARSVDTLKQIGYEAGLTMQQRLVTKNDDFFILPRIGIGGNDTIESFKLKLAGVIPLFKR